MSKPYELTLPLSKTKKIAKTANASYQFTPQAVQMLTFCGEYITRFVMQEAEKEAQREGSKQINYSHIRKVIQKTPGLAFLEDTIPERFILGGELDGQE